MMLGLAALWGCGPSMGNLEALAMAGRIHDGAAVKAKVRIGFPAKPGCVWKSITEIDAWGVWNPKVSGARLLDRFGPKADFKWKAGGMPIRSRVQRVDSGRVLTWTGTMLGIKAIRKWELEENAGDSARIEVAESLDGLIVRPFLTDRSLAAELDRWLVRLKDHCEEDSRP